MANEGASSLFRGISLEQAHEVRREKIIIKLQEQVRRLTKELEQLKGSVCIGQRSHYRQEFDVSSNDIAYTSSHEDYDDEDKGVRRRKFLRDYLRDFKIKAPEFDRNINIKNYTDSIQFMERIFELKEYNKRRLSNWSLSR